MSNLGDFLLARIAEDEKAIRQATAPYDVPHWPGCDYPGDTPGYCDCGYPARVLAECAFKREIVRLWDETEEGTYGDQGPSVAAEAAYALAAVYVDHPDYRGEWRP